MSALEKEEIYTVENILKELKNEIISDGDDVLRAVKKKCLEGDVKFKILKIKPYLNANGYYHSVLDQININARTG